MNYPNEPLKYAFLRSFEKALKDLELTEEDINETIHELLTDPKSGPVMPGTGGARKVRYATGNRGKSAGARIIYADFSKYGKVYFITAYSKHEKENLSRKERNELKKMLKRLEEDCKKNCGR